MLRRPAASAEHEPGCGVRGARRWHAGARTTTGLDGTSGARHRQARARRSPAGDLRAGTPTHHQDDRARGLLLRRHLVDGVRDRGDPASSSRSCRRASRSASRSSCRSRSSSRSCSRSSSTSYRQTIFAYPSGGGSYIVSRENLGEIAVAGRGRVAARRLHPHRRGVDLAPASPRSCRSRSSQALHDHASCSASAIVVFITVANLRGIKESGRIFAVPDVPLHRHAHACSSSCGLDASRTSDGSAASIHDPVTTPRPSARARRATQTGGTLGLFLLLQGFSSGAVALTGVEAISNGVPAFQRPESKNAATTLVWMAMILGTLFLGVSVLAHHLQPYPERDDESRCSRRWASTVFGDGFLYWVLQLATAGDPHARREHGLRRLPAAVVDHRPRRLSAAPAREPRRPARVLATACSCSRSLAGALIVVFGGNDQRADPAVRGRRVHVVHAVADRHGAPSPEGTRAAAGGATSVINAIGAVATAIVALDHRDHEVHRGRVGVRSSSIPIDRRAVQGHQAALRRRSPRPARPTPTSSRAA